MIKPIGSGWRVLFVAAALCLAALPAQALDKVRFNLAWLPQGSTGGVLVAQAKGFYTAAGIEVQVQRGYGGQRTVNEIDQGLFEFGYGDPISVMLNRSQGGKTTMVGAINSRWPGALCYLDRPDRHLRTLADLKGLSLGGGMASPVQNILPAWLRANGLPLDHLKLLRLDPAVINPSLLQGKIDLAECWEGANKPLLEQLAQRNGLRLGALRYRDFKLDLYGNGIVASEKLIAGNPDLVKRFVQATYRGYEFMRQQPEQAVELIAAGNKLLDKTILLQQIRETNELLVEPGQKLGTMNADRMQATRNFVNKAFTATTSVPSSEVYTNRFVE